MPTNLATSGVQSSGSQNTLNANAPAGSLNSYIQAANDAIRRAQNGSVGAGNGRLNPEYFYTMQLLETIRLDADQYVYFRYADEMPIENKANRITIRRWTPLHAHTTPLVEGVPPVSDRASAESYDIVTMQYGRFMEFTDMVDIKLVDPVIANYTKEYSIVAIETLDMLARNALALVAQPYFAGFQATSLANATTGMVPSMNELRRIILDMKKLLVKPRADKHFHVIAGPEFYFDMITDPLVEKYMRFNRDTYTMYSDNSLVPMFGMAFYETLAAPASGVYFDQNGVKTVRIVATDAGTGALVFGSAALPTNYTKNSDYTLDSRTGRPTDFNPDIFQITVADSTGVPSINGTAGTAPTAWVNARGQAVTPTTLSGAKELKVAQVYILGKDALIRTSIKGQGDAQVIVKALGSSGVSDPLNQRQSIGFKINSVGFGNARAEAVSCYYCVPSSLNV